MSKRPEYTELDSIEVVAIRTKSILVNHPTRIGHIVTIGRSCLHSLTDDRVEEYDKKRIPLPVTMGKFRVFTWLAQKERMIPNERLESDYPRASEAGLEDTVDRFESGNRRRSRFD